MDLLITAIICISAVIFLVRRYKGIAAGKENMGCVCSDCDKCEKGSNVSGGSGSCKSK